MDEELLVALKEFTKQDSDKIKECVNTEPWCNYYEYVEDFKELGLEIINDEAFEDEVDESFDIIEKHLDLEDYEELEKYLKKQGWRIASNNFAIQFDDSFIEKFKL